MPPSASKPKSRGRRFAERAGRRGEFWAELYLRAQFYRIRARRAKTPVGEIDLVAERFGELVFIEVKSRAFSSDEAEAMLAVNSRRIVRAAQYWIGRHRREADKPMRFDVIFLAPFAWPRHLRNAFDAGR